MINRSFSQAESENQKKYTELVKKHTEELKKEAGRELYAFVLTLGCQQNESDSEKIMGMAIAMGYKKTNKPEKAGLIMVNTCAIREHAEQRALSFIGSYKKLKAENPYLIIGVCGCMVTQAHRSEELKHSYPYVDFVFGTSSLHRFPELLYEKIKENKRIFFETTDAEYLVAEGLPVCREDNRHAWVSIMYGCNNFCSYCIVPYVRGRERSREKEEIIKEVRELVAAGYKDITLLGQNVNSYGKDGEYGYDFADLLDEIADIDGDYLIRFMTSHPKDATHKLIDVMAKHKNIAPHFHLPLQSGSDRILKLMNRHYDNARYISTVEYLREKIPDIVITSDIIVGFPGETEEEFEETLDMLKKIRFDMIYSFIFSPRKGTPAYTMDGQIPQDIKSRRYNELLKVQGDISLSKNIPMTGTTVRVLCDGISKTDREMYSGRTAGNKIVFFEGNENDTGNFVNVRIDRAEAFSLFGTKVSQ